MPTRALTDTFFRVLKRCWERGRTHASTHTYHNVHTHKYDGMTARAGFTQPSRGRTLQWGHVFSTLDQLVMQSKQKRWSHESNWPRSVMISKQTPHSLSGAASEGVGAGAAAEGAEEGRGGGGAATRGALRALGTGTGDFLTGTGGAGAAGAPVNAATLGVGRRSLFAPVAHAGRRQGRGRGSQRRSENVPNDCACKHDKARFATTAVTYEGQAGLGMQ